MTNSKKDKNYVIYTRSACEDQESLKQQHDVCLTKMPEGSFFVNCYNDMGCSGLSMNRPGMQKLIKDVNDGRIDCVIVADIARISRSDDDYKTFVSLLQDKGVDLVIADK